MRIISCVYTALALTTAATAIGCASTSKARQTEDPMVQPTTGARLEIVGSRQIVVGENSETTLTVRAVGADELPKAGLRIDFDLDGETAGAELASSIAETNQQGEASVVLRSARAAEFDVVAAAGELNTVAFEISVDADPFGTIEYTVSYGGSRPVRTAEVALFTNTTCARLARTVPNPIAVDTPRLGRADSFTDVQLGIPVAVYALGIDATDNVAAEKCTDATLRDRTTALNIDLTDVTMLLGGTYATNEEFNLLSGAPPAVDLVMELIEGLGSDEARDGSGGPGGALVDLILNATKPDICSSSGCATFRSLVTPSVARELAKIVNDALGEIEIPDVRGVDVADILNQIRYAAGDFSSALRGLQFVGELELPQPENVEFESLTGEHTITGIRVNIMSGPVEQDIEETSAEFGVTSTETGFAIENHTLNVDMKYLATLILNDIVLPRIPGEPHSLGDLIRLFLDCDALADAAAARVTPGIGSTITGTTVSLLCDLGTTVGVAYAEDKLLGLADWEELTVTGDITVTDTDSDLDADALDGDLHGIWEGGSGSFETDGSMAGARLNDEEGRENPVRAKLGTARN